MCKCHSVFTGEEAAEGARSFSSEYGRTIESQEGAMQSRRIGLLLMAAGAAVVALPASQAAPAAPDFSGFWAHPALGFGPPLSGPGPVRNTSRLPSGAGNFDRLVGDYSNP